MDFEKIKAKDLDKIKEFSHEGLGDINPIIELYLKLEFCYSIKLVDKNEIIGIGTAILYKNTSWIAHLIVKEKYRNNGDGLKILDCLCKYCRNNGYKSILLFATDMGYPLYKNYGFKIQTEYVQYERTKTIEYNSNINIMNIGIKDHEEIYKLDKLITGEDRQNILSQYINGGFVYKRNNKTKGFYLNDPGEKVIIAEDEEAGLELLKLRTSNNKYSTIPIGNISGNKFYVENTFKELKKIKRMIYGNEIMCKNENIYNRIGGNFG